jgi:hypothetical protein
MKNNNFDRSPNPSRDQHEVSYYDPQPVAVRRYVLTLDNLKRLCRFAEDAINVHKCTVCGSRVCEDCQHDADLFRQLADAVRLAEVGVKIIFIQKAA